MIPTLPATIHFIAIGGIGMSGLAQIMHHMGYNVRGSDVVNNAVINNLISLGIQVFPEQCAQNVTNNPPADLFVISSAIKSDNVELQAAIKSDIPIIKRGQLLAELIKRWPITINVAGTHGKTTITAMISHILQYANLDPCTIVGGIMNNAHSNVTFGGNEIVVSEADESDGTFMLLSSNVAVVSNIDQEHMEYYGSFDNVINSYCDFLHKVNTDGWIIACGDCSNTTQVVNKIRDKNVTTYGIYNDCDIKATDIMFDIDGTHFNTVVNSSNKNFFIPMHGEHNVLNALAAIIVTIICKVDINVIAKALRTFQGVQRRFTIRTNINGVMIVDDYAHHPKEINAAISMAKIKLEKMNTNNGRIIVVMQPHRYTRLHTLWDDFVNVLTNQFVDIAIITDVYSAGENPINDVTGEKLFNNVKVRREESGWHNNSVAYNHTYFAKDYDALKNLIATIASADDIVLCVGAGTISQWTQMLVAESSKLS